MVVSAVEAVWAQNAAHDLANKFSETGSKALGPKDDAQREAYEAEMLERARQEARERVEAEIRADAEAEAQRKSMEAQREAEAQALAEKLKRADEARKAKAEAVDDRPFKPALTNTDKTAKPPIGTPSPIVVAPPAAPAKPAEVAKDANPAPVPPASTMPAAANKSADVAGQGAQVPTPPAAASPAAETPHDLASEPAKVLPPPMALGRPAPLPPVATAPVDARVTILLVMEPGKKGIRRFNKMADPVICEDQLCFVSNGAGAPARVLALRKALGPGNTFGKRAGACRNKLTCVFRGVPLTGTAPTIQPVDLKVLVHDRREARSVSGDASCRVVAARLSCGRTVVAQGYRAWIVPENVAEAAGSAALEAAVMRGLVASPLREASVRP